MAMDETTLAELVAASGVTCPRETPTIKTVLKTIVVPYLGGRGNFDNLLVTIPASRLYAALAADGAGWAKDLAAKLPNTTTHQKAYCRVVRRLVAYGEAAGLLHPDQFLISPAWRALEAELAHMKGAEPPTRRSAFRGAFKQLARWATAHGVEPTDMPLCGCDGRPMAAFYQTFREDRDGNYFRARNCWNLLAAAGNPGFRHWGPIRRGRRAGRPRHVWPPVLEQALEVLFIRDGLVIWRDTTRTGYRARFATYLGVLDELGVDVDAVLACTIDPTDALRLLFQGVPAGTPKLDARQLAVKLVADPGFRTTMLATMAELTGSFDGRASETNPFLMETVAALVDAGTVTTGADLINKAIAINRGVLDLTDRHTTWLTRARKALRQLALKNPTAYAHKKRAVFKHPTLWKDLVRARSRLRAQTLTLERAWPTGVCDAAAKRAWAVMLRNEVIFGLLLCYPLRAANVTGMKLGQHYRPDTHQIAFEADETKNAKEIDYELPIGGALGDVRELMDRYLCEARPVLLACRQSDHLFVPDPRGGTSLREKGLNAILADLSRRFLVDVLPPGVNALNPHLIRHAVASYALAICQNLNLAAQLLNDSPSTILSAYADVLANKKGATKDYLAGVSL